MSLNSDPKFHLLNLIIIILCFPVINSWGKFPTSGFLSGTFTDLGAYDQCLGIEKPNESIGSGQYCLVDFKPHLPKLNFTQNLFHKIDLLDEQEQLVSGSKYIAEHAQFSYFLSWRIGICVPGVCQTKEIESLAKQSKKILN